jgi:hypothetical protein
MHPGASLIGKKKKRRRLRVEQDPSGQYRLSGRSPFVGVKGLTTRLIADYDAGHPASKFKAGDTVANRGLSRNHRVAWQRIRDKYVGEMVNNKVKRARMEARLKRLWTTDKGTHMATDPRYKEASGLVDQYYNTNSLSIAEIGRLARVMNSAGPNLRLADDALNTQIGPKFDPPRSPGGHYTVAAERQRAASPEYEPHWISPGVALSSDGQAIPH